MVTDRSSLSAERRLRVAARGGRGVGRAVDTPISGADLVGLQAALVHGSISPRCAGLRQGLRLAAALAAAAACFTIISVRTVLRTRQVMIGVQALG